MSDELHDAVPGYPNLSKRYQFDRETARKANERSLITRRNKKLARELEQLRSAPPTQQSLTETTLRQIQEIDWKMKSATLANQEILLRMKSKLWLLLYPKPKPGRSQTLLRPAIAPLPDDVQEQV